jgi:flagellar motility protein MotE (MotC chaperone)
MIPLLQSKWMALAVGVALYTLTSVFAWRTPKSPHQENPNTPGGSAPTAASWDFQNPELDQLVADLKKEKAALNQREQQLTDLANRLQTERLEINQVTQTVHQLQAELDRTVVRVQDEETANLKKLAKMYASMTPESAMTILRGLDDSAVVKIMVFMKEEEAAPILEALAKRGELDAKRTALISEKLRLTVFRKTVGKTTP